MMRKIACRLIASILSLAVVVVLAGDAFAGWRWHGSNGGSSGGYSGGWGGSSGGWGGSGGGWGGSSGGWGGSNGGSSGGWGGGHHRGHHRGWFNHRGWGGSNGGWGGSSGGWGGSSSGWGGSSGGSSGGSYFYAPEGKAIDPSTAPADPGAGAPPPPASTSIQRADGTLAVSVPQDAKIFVNGNATTSTGSERQFVSRALQTGFNYTYEVKAEVVRDGQTIEQVKTVNLRAGQTAELAFNFAAADAPETSLTVNVPADAKVYLAGNPTNAKGQKRIFRTTGLSGGKAWDDYIVRVEFELDGEKVIEEKSITLRAGESQELTFAGEAERVAAR